MRVKVLWLQRKAEGNRYVLFEVDGRLNYCVVEARDKRGAARELRYSLAENVFWELLFCEKGSDLLPGLRLLEEMGAPKELLDRFKEQIVMDDL